MNTPSPNAVPSRVPKNEFSMRALLIIVCLFFYIPITWHYGWNLKPGASTDFPSYYHAAEYTFVQGITPFGPHVFDQLSADWSRIIHPYLYPPPSLLAFWPLALLPYDAAFGAFQVLSHLCFLGSVWLLLTSINSFPRAFGLRQIAIGLTAVYLFNFHPSLQTLGLGQVNHITFFFLCLALVAFRRSAAPWMVALPLALAILLKTYPALLVIFLFSARRYKEVFLTCAIFAVFVGLSLVTLPAGVWTSWITEIMPRGGFANNSIAPALNWNQNINGFISRLFLENPFVNSPWTASALAKPLATILALFVAGLTFLTCWRFHRSDRSAQGSDDLIAAFLLMIFLIAPLSWDHHLVYILPAIVQAICLIVAGAVNRKMSILLTACLFLIAWFIPLDHPKFMQGWGTLLISIKFYPVVVLWAYFVYRCWQNPRLPWKSANLKMNSVQPPFVRKKMARETVSLAIVTPMANEAEGAEAFIKAVLKECDGFRNVRHFVVLDNATKDNTREILENFAKTEPRLCVVWAPENRGVVDAYVRGYREALK
ncbi:MAG TPA: glycosyltransferase 87 family protein, partial [Chthoniobacterales bacterium]